MCGFFYFCCTSAIVKLACTDGKGKCFYFITFAGLIYICFCCCCLYFIPSFFVFSTPVQFYISTMPHSSSLRFHTFVCTLFDCIELNLMMEGFFTSHVLFFSSIYFYFILIYFYYSNERATVAPCFQ